MKVLITGGAGFIGAATAARLAAEGHEVTVVDSLSEQIHGSEADGSYTYRQAAEVATIVRGDVRDRALMFDLVPEFDSIIHLAAETGTGQSMYDIVRYNDVNVLGTALLLEALVDRPGRVRRLVIASSRSIYGEGSYACLNHGVVHPSERDPAALAAGAFDPVCPSCKGPITAVATAEDAALAPASIYAVTKLAQEQLMIATGRARTIPTVALRYQNVYGPGQSLSNPYTGILSIFSREMLAGRPIEIFEDGLESRDFVHVEDVAAANVTAATGEACTGTFNIGSGIATSVIDLARELARNYDYGLEPAISGRFRAGDIRHNFANIQKAQQGLGWAPQVDLADGLAGFCAWVRGHIGGESRDNRYKASLQELQDRGLLGRAMSGNAARPGTAA